MKNIITSLLFMGLLITAHANASGGGDEYEKQIAQVVKLSLKASKTHRDIQD